MDNKLYNSLFKMLEEHIKDRDVVTSIIGKIEKTFDDVKYNEETSYDDAYEEGYDMGYEEGYEKGLDDAEG